MMHVQPGMHTRGSMHMYVYHCILASIDYYLLLLFTLASIIICTELRARISMHA